MPEDKRPKPVIDMTAEDVTGPAPQRLAPPRGNGGGARDAGASAKPAGDKPVAPKERRGRGRFVGYLLAGIVGGAMTAGAGYFALKKRLLTPSAIEPVTAEKIQLLEDQIASLERARRMAPASASTSAIGQEGINEVRARLDGIMSASRSLDQAVQSLSQRVQALEQKPGGGQSKDAVQAEISAQLAPVSQRIATMEREVEALVRAQNERQSDARAAALTLALTNLKRAISDGRPFAAELAAVENISSTKLPVSQLAPYKDEGVSSLADLQSEFASASQKTIEKYYTNKSNGIMGEVLNRAKAAIQVRPAGSKGDSVEAILGRMEASLKAGDLKAALAQGAALEDPPEEMRAWFAKAQARVAADEAIRKTDQELLASLTKPQGRRQ
jgi:hypothetical protein